MQAQSSTTPRRVVNLSDLQLVTTELQELRRKAGLQRDQHAHIAQDWAHLEYQRWAGYADALPTALLDLAGLASRRWDAAASRRGSSHVPPPRAGGCSTTRIPATLWSWLTTWAPSLRGSAPERIGGRPGPAREPRIKTRRRRSQQAMGG